MSSEQIILTAADCRAIGAPIGKEGERVSSKTRRAIHPMKLIENRGYALSPEALTSATASQQALLKSLPRRQVEEREYQWFADAEAEQASAPVKR